MFVSHEKKSSHYFGRKYQKVARNIKTPAPGANLLKYIRGLLVDKVNALPQKPS